MNRPIRLLSAWLVVTAIPAFAQDTVNPAPPPAIESAPPPAAAKTGSTAFCLYELPAEQGKRRWLNLGIVQYLEFNRNELKIYYGGGNLGSGHEARLPIVNPGQLEETLDQLRQAAAGCR